MNFADDTTPMAAHSAQAGSLRAAAALVPAASREAGQTTGDSAHARKAPAAPR